MICRQWEVFNTSKLELPSEDPHCFTSEFNMKHVHACMHGRSLQSCLTLCSPMDCSLPGCSVPGILQARILEWAACPPLGDLPKPGIKPTSPAAPTLQAYFLYRWATREASIWNISNVKTGIIISIENRTLSDLISSIVKYSNFLWKDKTLSNNK